MFPRLLLSLTVAQGVVTDPPEATTEPVRWALRSEQAGASTHQVEGWATGAVEHHPNLVLDGDPATAWMASASGVVEGAVLTLPVTTLSSARSVEVRIRNGWQASPEVFSAHGAAAAVQLVARRPDGGRSGEVSAVLARTSGWQTVVLPVSGGLTQVELWVRSASAGAAHGVPAISDVELWVETPVPEVPEVEAAKLAAVRAWVASRPSGAAGADRPVFAPGGYTWSEVGDVTPDAAALDARLAAARAAGTPSWRLTSRETSTGPVPVALLPVRGQYELSRAADLLRLADLAVVRARSSSVQWLVRESWHTMERRPATIVRSASGEVTDVVFEVFEVQDERERWESEAVVHIHYEAGLARTVYVKTSSDGSEVEGRELTTLVWSDDGRVTAWMTTSQWGEDAWSTVWARC